jgi:hypothetical protein
MSAEMRTAARARTAKKQNRMRVNAGREHGGLFHSRGRVVVQLGREVEPKMPAGKPALRGGRGKQVPHFVRDDRFLFFFEARRIERRGFVRG